MKTAICMTLKKEVSDQLLLYIFKKGGQWYFSRSCKMNFVH